MLFYYMDKPDLMIPAIQKCIDYLEKLGALQPGYTADLDGGIRCTVTAYETVEESRTFWEAHRRYVDVHCVISGEERVSVCSLADAQAGPYHEDRDYLEVVGVPMVEVRMTPGTVLCLFPNDVHRTKVEVKKGKSERVLKAIFKVPVELTK